MSMGTIDMGLLRCACVCALAVPMLSTLPACGSETTGETNAVVLTELTFGKLVRGEDGEVLMSGDRNVAAGLNLDDRNSDARDLEGCRRRDFVSPAGEEGIDNQFALLYETIEDQFPGAVEGIIQGTINEGRLLLMIEMSGVDDPYEDDSVEVRVMLGMGRPDLSASDRIASHQTFEIDPEAPVSITHGSIHEGVLEAGPFDVEFPVAVFNVFFDLRLHNSTLQATQNPDGSWSGIIAGGVTMAQILNIAMMADDMQETQITPLLEIVLPTMSDLQRNDMGVCEQISAGMQFRATPAFTF